MLCSQVFQSIAAWQKLSGVSMKPKLAFKILMYTKKVAAEHEAVEKQRIALVHEITGTKPGEEVKIEPDTDEFKKYIVGLQEILLVESDLKPLDLDFEEVVNAVDKKDESLTIADLSALEPFFKCCPDDCDCDNVVPVEKDGFPEDCLADGSYK